MTMKIFGRHSDLAGHRIMLQKCKYNSLQEIHSCLNETKLNRIQLIRAHYDSPQPGDAQWQINYSPQRKPNPCPILLGCQMEQF